MSQPHTYPIPADIAQRAFITEEIYRQLYQESVNDPTAFWDEHGKIIDWISPYTQVKNTSFDPGHIRIRWFEDGTLNVSANCLDRHLAERGEQTAIIWEGDNPEESQTLTYRQLHLAVCRFANVLTAPGVVKGDVVAIYIPLVPDAAV